MSEKDKNGWSEYEKLVLSDLKRLEDAQKTTNDKLDKLIGIKDTVEDLKKWKTDVADKEFQDLKSFKTQIITLGVVIQFITAGIIALKDKLFS